MLPAEVIETYRESLGLDEVFSRSEFFKLIRAMDRLWYKAYSVKQEKAKAAKPKKPPRKK